jgi:3-oxoisoapionate kinase
LFSGILQEARERLAGGKSLILHSALGPDDPRIAETTAALSIRMPAAPGRLAGIQGKLLRLLLLETGIRRAVVVGGDTSGYVSRELGIYALEIRMPVAPGAPLCTAHSRNPAFDGMEISLKGGQNGSERYFEQILNGAIN